MNRMQILAASMCSGVILGASGAAVAAAATSQFVSAGTVGGFSYEGRSGIYTGSQPPAGDAYLRTVGGSNVPAGYMGLPDDLASVAPFAVNEAGLTYGAGTALRPVGGPDLVSAYGVDGTLGFVRARDVAPPAPRTLKEARAQATNVTRSVPLYAVDGVTVIGTFEIEPSVPGIG